MIKFSKKTNCEHFFNGFYLGICKPDLCLDCNLYTKLLYGYIPLCL